ncbi:putative metallopeptidase [Clostridium hydrogeniformans]|uniref:putative metallopeptidase n=1 Tax=Clostridium hydrogeniformans TaxID=349933 RepID=UPI0004849C6E|nr:putative metallopeptidase [Clostridium hydrogeniformans]
MQIKVIDDKTGRLIDDINCVGFNLQFVTSDGNGQIQKITNLNNGKYGAKHWIKNDIYQPIAKKIKEKLKKEIASFSVLNINKILFIEDIDYIGDEVDRNTDWVMKIKKAPVQLTEYTGYKFIIESREFWMERISEEQIVAHIYSCLKQIDGDKLIEPDIKGWKEVIGNLGYGWETTLSPIHNLLDGFDKEDFMMLKKADKQLMFNLKNA